MTDLARARALVKELGEVLGEDEQSKPEPVTITGTRYEPSEDPGRPGVFEVTILSSGEERRQFLPRAARGDYVPDELEGEIE